MKFKYKQKTFNIFGVSKEDHIYQNIVNNHTFYEIDLLEYISNIRKFFQPENSITIDVGANIGNHSIYFESFICDHVIAIEPNSEVLPILIKNLRLNTNNYTIYENALGEEESVGRIILPENSKKNNGMTKIECFMKNDGTNNTIKILTLDSIIDDWKQKNPCQGCVSMIKIDVEGMELAVLKGAQNTIRKYRPHLFIEAATLTEFNELNHYLNSLGYRPLTHLAVTPVYHFAFKPTKSLRIFVSWFRFLRKVKKVKRKYIGRIKSLTSH